MDNTTALTVFNFQGQEIRVTVINGEPWWVAADVCTALDIANVSDAVSKLDEDERITIATTDSNRGNPNKLFVNEPGLYGLIFVSRKTEAKAFKRWVTHKVLPAIRKTGSYTVPGLTPATDPLARIETQHQEVIRANRQLAMEYRQLRYAFNHPDRPEKQLAAPRNMPHSQIVMLDILRGKRLTYTAWVAAGMNEGLAERTAKDAIGRLKQAERVSQAGKYYFISAESEVRLDALEKIAKALGVKAADLIEDEEE